MFEHVFSYNIFTILKSFENEINIFVRVTLGDKEKKLMQVYRLLKSR